jgi:hypothetical protein
MPSSPAISAAERAALRRYAGVILEVGVALTARQDLAVNAHLDHAPFARILCDEAYRRGAQLVDVWYWDPHTKLARLRHAPLDTLARTPAWLDERYRRLAEAGGALVNLAGDPEPDLLRGVDEARAGLDRMPGLTSRFDVQARNEAVVLRRCGVGRVGAPGLRRARRRAPMAPLGHGHAPRHRRSGGGVVATHG